MSTLPLFLAETQNEPLFGNQWLALLAILAGIALFMAAVAYAGRWLAATHPDAPAKPAASIAAAPNAASITSTGPAPETLAVIAAAVAVTFGSRARVAGVQTVTPSVEMLMQQWSIEGRRQIYSSHQVR